MISVVSVRQLVPLKDQNALHRLLAFMLEEHCCCTGQAGSQSLLLFGLEILTCEIATASASTKPASSWSSDLQLELPEKETGPKASPKGPPRILRLSDSSDATCWLFTLDLMDSVFNVRSVKNKIHGCPETNPSNYYSVL